MVKKRNLVKNEDINQSEIPTILIKCVKGMAYERNSDYKKQRKEARA
ncbi:MAG: hypothetical protein NTZ83_00330 [Candidatus Pacearchaeota archaeon]|nr:hypothetical protein [Candidatus Pacearchaeota archaeon]